tara:strand:- start:840 stop:2603 length:1764 start_codon:yes stop_codon:yes gene_type:complete
MATKSITQEELIFGHPKGLFILFFTELWERFSYYGMRALLTLYIATSATAIDPGLGWSSKDAIWLYGWYTMLVYVASIPGGWIADKYIGQKKAVMYGGFLLCLGHGVLAINSPIAFFSGLVLIILGVGSLKPNISTMVGGLYPQGDPRRDSGFTIFYIGINIGAFLSSLIVGVVAYKYGWHYGFGLAGIGMLFGQAVFIYGQKYLTEVGNFLGNSKNKEDSELMKKPLTKIEKDRVIVLLISFLIVIVFWGAFEQAGGLMNLYTEAKVDRFLGLSFLEEVPAAVFQSLNAGYIIIFGTLVGAFWIWMKKRNYESSSLFKMALGTIIMGLGFVFMMFASIEASSTEFGKAAMYWIFLAYFFHTIGELCASPVALSFITKLSPVKYGSLMMGIYFAATGFGNKLAAGIGEASQIEKYKGELVVQKDDVFKFIKKDSIEIKELIGGKRQIVNKFDYPINLDKNFSIKSKIKVQDDDIIFYNYPDETESLNNLFEIDSDSESSLKKYLRSDNSSNTFHANLFFEKDIDNSKNVVGDGNNYKLSFVVEEQQSDQEYKIFTFLTIFTVAFGFLVLIFLKKLKKLTHGAEDMSS